MPVVKKISDKIDLVPTSAYKYGKFPFEFFNQVQSAIFDIHDTNNNVVIAAQTGVGKTLCAELIMGFDLRKNKGKIIYISPMKALGSEKFDDWTAIDHHFGDLKVEVCSSDYKITDERLKVLKDADIILITPEMLNARLINYNSEKSEFLTNATTLIFDEFHTIATPSRGSHVEVGLMKFGAINPKAKLVLLSATMPNVDEVANWAAKLTNRDTYFLNSSYRSVPLSVHYETYEKKKFYDQTEEEKVRAVVDIVNDYKEDKFIVFVHVKKTGEMAKKAIAAAGYDVEFHCADLDKDARRTLEKKFRSGNLHVIVATSTIAYGCNLPARRVIITGVHRGLSEVENYDVFQMIGRSGRPGYDPRGDAYILLPEGEEDAWIKKLNVPVPLTSRLLDYLGEDNPHYKTLAFHLVSEIHHNAIKTKEDVHTWYERSFAHFQAQDLNDEIVDSTLDLLINTGAIKLENDIYKTTVTGTIASMFYYSPFDVSDLRKNFNSLFQNSYEDNDIITSMALANTDTLRLGIVSRAEREEMSSYATQVANIFGKGKFNDPAIKAGYCYFILMNGLSPGIVGGVARGLQWDFPRMIQVLHALDGMAGKWDKRKFINDLGLRVAYGVKSNLLGLVNLEGIGKARAERLWAAGIKNAGDVVLNENRIGVVAGVGPDMANKIVENARIVSLSE